MKLMVTWHIRPENLKAVLERFEGGAGEPPAGVELLGRWHATGTGDGFGLFEVDDAVAFTGFLLGWADLVEQKVVPVVEDADLAATL